MNTPSNITPTPHHARRIADRRAVNPHLAQEAPQPPEAVYARLPQAPVTASPVPGLTSLFHYDQFDPYGDRRYPGNCGGMLIRDLLCDFRPARVLDLMTGSGTCRQVCRDLRISCVSRDARFGFDATNPGVFNNLGLFDFIWAHPPYWRQKIYFDHPRDLSRTPTLDAFLAPYEQFIRNAADALASGGKLAILMGDYTDRQAGFTPLTYHTKRLAFEAGLHQCCTDIIRFSHGASSGRKVYRSSFIPGLHDVCMVFER